jgi:anthranilate phosphoribosyltransferase
MSMKKYVEQVMQGVNLSDAEATKAFNMILSGEIPNGQIAAFLTALRVKGESADEIAALVRIMRKNRVVVKASGALVDTCGTGGKAEKTFNVSTCIAFILAAGGVKVAKHGNRSATGICGSADVLEQLGVPIDVAPERIEACIASTNFGFMFAPKFHPIMKAVVPVRKELGFQTIFNLAGPLTNPAGAKYQLFGVNITSLVPLAAATLSKLGTKRAFIVNSDDVGDEISPCGKTLVCEVNGTAMKRYTVTPKDFGCKPVLFSQIKTSPDARGNAKRVFNVLSGMDNADRTFALINAAAAFVVMGKAKDLKSGAKLAAEIIDSGKALAKLQDVIAFLKEGN